MLRLIIPRVTPTSAVYVGRVSSQRTVYTTTDCAIKMSRSTSVNIAARSSAGETVSMSIF